MKYLLTILSISLIVVFATCVTVQKIKDGETAFERKRYAQAISLLRDEYRNASTEDLKAHKAYYLGEAHRRLGELSDALKWYQKAVDKNYGSQAMAQYAFTLKQKGKFAEAKKLLQYLSNEYPQDRRVSKELNSIKILKGWDENKKYRNVSLENPSINTEYSEYYPRLFNENEILFISDRLGSTGDKNYHWTGRAFSDLYLYNIDRGMVRKYDDKLSTGKNEGMITSDRENKTVIFTRCGTDSEDTYDDAHCQLYLIENPNTYYQKVKKLPFVNKEHNYIHPTLNERGDILIFSGFLPEGQGNYDLWYSQKVDGVWQQPQLLSSRLNTRGDEMFPNWDGDTLYFSSNYLTGYGGLDIFKTFLRNDGSWSPPQNLKSPINSGADDFGFVPDRKYAETHNLDFAGFFSSNREGGKGADDIYFFKQKKIKKPEKELKEDIAKLQLKLQVKKKEFNETGNPNSGVRNLRNLSTARINVKSKSNNDTLLTVNNLGNVLIPLDTATDYSFNISAQNYLSTSFTMSTDGKMLPDRDVTTLLKTVVLDSIIKNVEIVLESIYYDFDRWEIREDAKPTLDTLAMLLRDNPQLNIEMNSHTDCRGNNAYNRDLSQKRAQSAVDYLVMRGIRRERLTAKGYGETQPQNDCSCQECTEEEHQENRRTSFTIVD